ncbi:MAG: TonB-dependent receptor [bacterium]|nr:MAG: TonB-dependent receptor [bacterium]
MKLPKFMYLVTICTILLSTQVSKLQADKSTPTGNMKGRILDSETKEPLIAVNIEILNTINGAATDLDGYYFIPDIPVGNYSIRISYLGYEPQVQTDLIVRPDRTTFVNTELKKSIIEMETVTVTAGYFSNTTDQPLSIINFSAEEIRRAPGSAGDVSRIIYGLPGVAKVNDTKNSLIVRGGSALENSFYVDNIEITNINHFPEQGSSGGPIGMINVDLIKDVNFYTGGFDASYGDRLSSVMELRFREGDRDRFNAQLDLGLAGFGGVAEGPWPNQKGSWLVAARRSYLDLIVGAIGETNSSVPQYSDVQTKLTYELSPHHQLTAIGVMGWDQIAIKPEDAIEQKLNMYNDLTILQNTFGLNWQYVWGKAGYSNTSFSHSVTQYNFALNETRYYSETGGKKVLLDQSSSEQEFRLRNVNHYTIHRQLKLHLGLETKYLVADFNNYYGPYFDALGNPTPELSIIGKSTAVKSHGFMGLNWRPFTRLTLIPALRLEHFSYNGNTHLSPRFSASYQLTENTAVNFSTGIYFQNLPLVLLAQNEENKNITDPRSRHLVMGISHLLTENTQMTLEVYDKEYSDMPQDPMQPELFLIDEVYYTGLFLPHGPLSAGGRANARGIELMIQKKLAESIYGMVSTSLFRSRYQDYNGNLRNRVYDNRLTFNVEGGYKPNNKWEFSLRWIYAGGTPFTPLDEQASTEANRGIYDVNQINTARLPDYHSLNLRLDRRFFFSGSNIVLYFSVWNAYGRKNIAGYSWNEIDNKKESNTQWNTLPILGLEYEF